MTRPIRTLPPDLASQIAAGEVVERPASVVKELLENALDAGAERVDVRIEGGGISAIEVSDDGHGMNADDAVACFSRHATSKLTSFDELESMQSFGFRGEALPSIASVSRVVLTTRSRGSEAGNELSLEGTTEGTSRPVGAPVGTSIVVRDLFFNVPARRKFLRSSNTEAGHVGETVIAAALGTPRVAFTLHREKRRVKNFPRVTSRGARVAQVLEGLELVECRAERGPLCIEAYLCPPENSRKGAAGLRLFVNGRPIKDRALAATIAHAYGGVLERGRYPIGVAYLDLPGSLVDINVHPQKAEVRFADPRAVSDALYRTVSQSLGRALSTPPTASHPRPPPARSSAHPTAASDPTSASSRPSPWQAGPQNPSAPSTGVEPAAPPLPRPSEADALQRGARIVRDGARPVSGQRYAFEQAPASQPPARDQPTAPNWKNLVFLNQVRKTYLVCESDDGLYVLDQHAAAERVVFSRLKAAYDARDVASQALLFPIAIDVTPEEQDVLERHGDGIRRMGLDVRVRGQGRATVHSVPRLLEKVSPERTVRDLLRELMRKSDRAYSDAIDKVLATMACHGAVRAGDPITPTEAQALLEALDGADFGAYCPHGRPIVTFTSWAELERKVGRR